MQNNSNQNTTLLNTTQNKQEEKNEVEIIKRIMSEQMTILLSLKNQDLKTVMEETEKINKLLTHISTNIMELNELIYAGVKLICVKIGTPLKNMNRNSKPEFEIRVETV